jgi:hypothetical protein
VPVSSLITPATVSSGVYFRSSDTRRHYFPFHFIMLFNTQSTLLVSTALFAASSVAQNGFKVVPRGSANGKLVGCYSSAPGYGSSKDYTYQSSGWCLNKCYAANSAAFALTGGSTCMCGDTLPPDSDKVDSSKCNRACTGWPSDMCMLPCLTLRTRFTNPTEQVVAATTTQSIPPTLKTMSQPTLNPAQPRRPAAANRLARRLMPPIPPIPPVLLFLLRLLNRQLK